MSLSDRKEWNYGKALKLTWGEREIRACDEKWTFVFDPDPTASDSDVKSC